jgi:hypothetical protein
LFSSRVMIESEVWDRSEVWDASDFDVLRDVEEE